MPAQFFSQSSQSCSEVARHTAASASSSTLASRAVRKHSSTSVVPASTGVRRVVTA
ncbi:MAG: hypothetical protein K0S40_1401 [Actinomycetospora sp.]|nr:hypothetical protein [Actinomycetospora sp.]